MSTALAIAGVTAVLRDLLNDGLVNHNISGVLGSTVTVSVSPPDRVVPSDGTETSQLNLFLHQVTPNPGYRNLDLPSRDHTGRQRLANPPLALDLHYLLSAYSAADLHGEILLGYAMQLLHEHPVLSREDIRTALIPSPDVGTDLPPALRALAECGLADQVEQLRITQEVLDAESMSKLWAATQAHYRPTAAYQVTVVLIESTRPVRSPLPVLSRGPVDPVSGRDRGVAVQPDLVPPVPTIEAVVPPGGQPVARLGETIDILGHHLDGNDREVRLTSDRFDRDEVLAATGTSEATRLQFVVPIASADLFPVGAYRVAAALVRPGEVDPRWTNSLALVLAPEITNLPQTVARDGEGTASFSLTFRPRLQAEQSVRLVLGQQEFEPTAFTAPVDTLDFAIPDAPVGEHLARLRIDGIDSPIIDRAAMPPVFLDQRIEIT
jgi:hypothetical protein